MKRFKQAKIWIRLQFILFKDILNGYVFRFAGKDKSNLAFNYATELSQEIKTTETLENKLYNIQEASKKINEYLLMPGEIFSFWKVIGNPEPGMKKSRTIVNSVSVNETGGGICQVSGIIYHISILAGLEILERHNHSIDLYTPETRFTPLGTDATVVYGYKDLRIKNNNRFPIKFKLMVSENKLTIKLLSLQPIEEKQLIYTIQKNKDDIMAIVSDQHQNKINQSIYKPPDNMKLRLSILFFISLFLSCNPKQNEKEVTTLTPLDQLKAGNERFVSGQSLHPHGTHDRIMELKEGQHPFVTIVSCSDSRIPPEIIFDQGLGDAFTIRTAGHVIGDYELGSIEYAVEHLHSKLIVVLGHENCGAVQAYAAAGHEAHTDDHIQKLVDYIASEEEEIVIPDSLRSNIDLLVKANIAHGVKVLKSSTPVLKPLVDRNEIQIIGAYYDLDSGKVLFDK